MSMENLGPYSNFHELNQDWFLDEFNKVLEQWKAMQKNFDSLQNAFNDLKNYVQDYFKNLDVQEEINNKLDEMFSNNSFWIKLTSVLPYVTPLMFGCVGDGITNDNTNFTTFLNYCTTNNVKGVLDPNKTYLTDNIMITNKIILDLNGSTIKCSGITINPTEITSGFKISNGNILFTSDNGITLTNVIQSIFSDLWIYDFKNACITCSGDNYETTFRNVYLRGMPSSPNTVGFKINSSDMIFDKCFGRDCNIFIDNNGASNIYKSCHAWITSAVTLPSSIFAKCEVSASFENCIVDTYTKGFYIKPNSLNRLVNNLCIINPLYYNKNILDVDCYFIWYSEFPDSTFGYGINIDGNYFTAPLSNTDVTCHFSNVDNHLSLCLSFFNNNYFNGSGFFNSPKTSNVNFTNGSGTIFVSKKEHALSILINGSLPDGFSTTTPIKIGTIPLGMRASTNFWGVLACGLANTALSNTCIIYVDVSGDIYITNNNTDNKFIYGSVTLI